MDGDLRLEAQIAEDVAMDPDPPFDPPQALEPRHGTSPYLQDVPGLQFAKCTYSESATIPGRKSQQDMKIKNLEVMGKLSA